MFLGSEHFRQKQPFFKKKRDFVLNLAETRLKLFCLNTCAKIPCLCLWHDKVVYSKDVKSESGQESKRHIRPGYQSKKVAQSLAVSSRSNPFGLFCLPPLSGNQFSNLTTCRETSIAPNYFFIRIFRVQLALLRSILNKVPGIILAWFCSFDFWLDQEFRKRDTGVDGRLLSIGCPELKIT